MKAFRFFAPIISFFLFSALGYANFEPVITFDFMSLDHNGTAVWPSPNDFTFTVSQEEWEDDVSEFMISTNSGMFDLDHMVIDDVVGTGSAVLGGNGPIPLSNITVELTVYGFEEDGTANVITTITTSDSDEYPVGSAAGGLQLMNTEMGAAIYIVSPGDDILVTNGYTSTLTISGSFIDPAIGSLEVVTDFMSAFDQTITDVQNFQIDEVGHYGDLNLDDAINVLDIVLLVDRILYGVQTEYEMWASDVNFDAAVNVLDIVLIVDWILNPTLLRWDAISSAQIAQDHGVIEIQANGAIAGVQMAVDKNFDILNTNLPEGWEMHHNNNTVLIFSMDGSSLVDPIQIAYDGEMEVSDVLVADWHGNGVAAEIVMVPETFAMGAAYPNPFNPVTSIDYSIDSPAMVNITVFNMMGQEITSLTNGYQAEGNYSITWSADNLPSAMYIIRMTVDNHSTSQKVMLLK